MTEKKRDIRNAVEQTALKVIDEKNDRIRKLEIVILTLSEADEKSRGGLTSQELAKRAVISFNIKCGWNKGEENVGA